MGRSVIWASTWTGSRPTAAVTARLIGWSGLPRRHQGRVASTPTLFVAGEPHQGVPGPDLLDRLSG